MVQHTPTVTHHSTSVVTPNHIVYTPVSSLPWIILKPVPCIVLFHPYIFHHESLKDENLIIKHDYNTIITLNKIHSNPAYHQISRQ